MLIICDRGVSHELVRHRLASYTQESTRYCNYSKLGTTFIKPMFQTIEAENLWEKQMLACEKRYNRMIELGESPQIARSILPNSLKTEIIATMNIRQWRHVLKLRTSKEAHPQIREVMFIIKDEFMEEIPLLFEDME